MSHSLVRPTFPLISADGPAEISRPSRPTDGIIGLRPRASQKPAAEDQAADDVPATSSDVARLEAQLATLLARDEERAAANARIEDAVLSMLDTGAEIQARMAAS
jgi:hypothetical protein